ncbi:acetyl-CoA hydrolase [Synergistales bacterium]|nr:acetyl-CoA hydrolase [Synergistales bacterium]
MSNDIFREKVRLKNADEKFKTADEAAALVEKGMIIGCSGFTPSGYPKVVPQALARRSEARGAIPITLWAGASVGPELDDELSRAGCIKKRFPYQTSEAIRKKINEGEILYSDLHLSHNAQNLRYGFHGDVDVAIVEALAITKDGIIPTTSVGNAEVFVELAKKVIVEINTTQPEALEGFHDIYTPKNPPNREPIPITKPSDRIGTTYIPCPIDKIAAIVHSEVKDAQRPLAEVDEVSERMASHLLDFLDGEVKNGRLPRTLLPLQSGVGNVANAVLKGLAKWPADGLTVYTEVVQDAVFELFDSGKISFASSTSLTPSPDGAAKYYPRLKEFADRLVLRPQEISNNPEVIRRLGLIAMNTAVEVDIYGHVNSTMVKGGYILNGIGGSGDFARNAYLTIFLCPSSGGNGKISKVVPFCSHVDHTEHDVDVIVTEHGVADLRNLSPRERSVTIIKNCADPQYRELLDDYRKRAEIGKGHEPHILSEALSWHARLSEKGTMRP